MKRISNSGFMTAEAIGALLIMAILIPVLSSMWQTGVNAMKKRAVAEHFMTVQKAAHTYAKQNHSTLLPQVSETSGPTISFATLKSAKCLPDRFNDTNAWGQSYQIVARKDKNNGLAMVVLTTGGRGSSTTHPEFANIMVPEAAALAKAGFIPTGLIGASGVIRGAYGGWEVSLASLGVSASPGHLGSISTLSADELAQDYLYRVAVPGQPELNAMQTSLDMTDHSIRQVKDVGFVPQDFSSVVGFCSTVADEGKTFLDAQKGLYLCRNGKTVLLNDTGNALMMQDARLVVHDQIIDKPICPDGAGLHPEIFVAPSILSSGEVSPTMASMQAWATNYSADQWQVKLRVLTAKDEWIYPEPQYGRMIVMTTCAKN